MQIPLLNVARKEEIEGLRLADIGCPVCCVFNDLALIQLKSRAENHFLMLVEATQMLNRPLMLKY